MKRPQKSPLLDADGYVVNVVLHHDDWFAPDGLTIGKYGGEIGDWWDGTQYVRMDRSVRGDERSAPQLQEVAPRMTIEESPLPVIPMPEPMEGEEDWQLPAFLRRGSEETIAPLSPEPPPHEEVPDIPYHMTQVAIEAATLIAIERISEATAAAAERLASIKAPQESTLLVLPPAEPLAATDPRDMVEDQVLYETAMRALNGAVEAIALLSEPASKLKCSALDLANKIIEDRKARERKIMTAYAARLGD